MRRSTVGLGAVVTAVTAVGRPSRPRRSARAPHKPCCCSSDQRQARYDDAPILGEGAPRHVPAPSSLVRLGRRGPEEGAMAARPPRWACGSRTMGLDESSATRGIVAAAGWCRTRGTWWGAHRRRTETRTPDLSRQGPHASQPFEAARVVRQMDSTARSERLEVRRSRD